MNLSAYKTLSLNGIAMKEVLIDGTRVWKRPAKNWVPLSTDTDGSIYNGTGYKDNTRLSSSGGVSGSAQAGSATVGFIPCTAYDVIRLKGGTWLGASGHYYINYYDANKNFLSGFVASAYTGNYDRMASVTYDASSGVTTFSNNMDLTGYMYIAQIVNAAYVRINAYGKGADLIVAVNEEI